MVLKETFNKIKRIPLAPYLLKNWGYKIDKDRDCVGWRALISPKGQRIITKKGADNRYFFICTTDDSTGDLIDLLRSFHNLSYREIVEEITPNFSVPLHNFQQQQRKPKLTEQEKKKIITEAWQNFGAHMPINYLTRRGIPAEVIAIYQPKSFKAKENGAIFLCYDLSHNKPIVVSAQVVQDLIYKRSKFFLKGLPRGLGLLIPADEEIGANDTIVVTEGIDDALGHQAMCTRNLHYVCTFGSLTSKGTSDITLLSARYDNVVLAFDNDAAGRKYNKALIEKIKRAKIEVPNHKDWMEDLQRKSYKKT